MVFDHLNTVLGRKWIELWMLNREVFPVFALVCAVMWCVNWTQTLSIVFGCGQWCHKEFKAGLKRKMEKVVLNESYLASALAGFRNLALHVLSVILINHLDREIVHENCN